MRLTRTDTVCHQIIKPAKGLGEQARNAEDQDHQTSISGIKDLNACRRTVITPSHAQEKYVYLLTLIYDSAVDNTPSA